jgi:cyanophycin synthetase
MDDAWKAAQEIGLPVVVKPKDGNQGKGVTVNIMTKEHLKRLPHRRNSATT